MQISLNINLLERLIDSLQACFSVEEGYQTIAPVVQQLFPNEAGAIYVMNPSKRLLEAIATWGPEPLTSDRVFAPHECLALQRKREHLVEDTHHGLICQHIHPHALPVETFCIPMMVHGETMGVLSISSLRRGQMAQTKQLALTVAKHIGLALANLKLREALNHQTFRDPLTKLYNRRYLEESLEREILRSQRHPQSLGLIILAIDRFHNFNETFGYAASEFLLKELGMFLPKQIRSSDLVCRYRGEEFALLLPQASLDVTYQRAEQLRQAIKNLKIEYRNEIFDSLTISCGVASFAEHGFTAKQVIHAAKAALNCAREQTGDRTVIYATPTCCNSCSTDVSLP